MKRFWKVKNLIALLLAVVMLASPAVTALAQGITLNAESPTVKPGEQVKVTVKVDEEITDVAGGEVHVQYDEDLFTFDKTASKVGSSNVSIKNVKKTDSESAYVSIFVSFMSGGTLSADEVLATLAFTANQNITEEKLATFETDIFTMQKVDLTELKDTFRNNPLSITVTPASTEAKGYSMEVKAVNPSVVVGEKVQVALKITNSDFAVTTYNAYHVGVSYDSDSLTYESSNLSGDTVSVDSGTDGTLKITGYGDNKTCGTDDIKLTFTTKKVGSSQVTVTSAKVDAKANASEKDAPDATLTTAEATITVGGYKVTLPDAFEGGTTVNPGENYTFTAKDLSKKYDFSESTMGGKDVTIQDNGDGTYTVKNVTGELVIKATEKVSKVKINLSGDATATITYKSWENATEVDAGTALSFTAMPAGKELIVTVNDEVITGMNIQGTMMRYTIAAEKVTGKELNITVNYKAANTITIVEKGDAWGGLTNITRNGWTASGDKISADTGSCSLRFKFASGKTLDDFVITINGTPANVRKSGPFYAFDFKASEVAKGGVITIDVSYKQTEPTYTIDVSEYLKLDGQTMYLVTASGDVADGKVLAYGDKQNQMYWSDEYNEGKGAYAWLIIPDKTDGTKNLEDLKADAAKAVTAVEGNKISIVYGGDVNLTNAVDINDAQFVWNMYNAEYKNDTTFQTVNRQKYLTADVNGDGVLDTTDAAAVVGKIIK